MPRRRARGMLASAMNPDAPPISLAGSQLGESRHICAFVHDSEEEYRVTLPYITDGFDRGDRAFHIVDPKLREDHLRRLTSAGIDVAAAQRSGRLELHDWSDTFFVDGAVDPERRLALFEE